MPHPHEHPTVRPVAVGPEPDPWELAVPDPVPATEIEAAIARVLDRSGTLTIDGRPAPPVLTAAGVHAGAALDLAHRMTAPAVVRLTAIDGPSAGTTWDLTPGVHLLGAAGVGPRGPGVAAHHALAVVHPVGTIEVLDLGAGPTTVDGAPIPAHDRGAARHTLGLAAQTIRIERGGLPSAEPTPGPARDPDGRRPFHRPPPAWAPQRLPPVALPGPEPVALEPPRLSIATVVLPALVGVIFAALVAPQWALFAIAGPLVAVGAWAESRWRARRRHRRALAAHLARSTAAAAEVDRRRAEEAAARRRRWPAPADLATVAHEGSGALWSQRPRTTGVLVLPVGSGTVAWEPPVDGDPPGRGSPLDVALSAGLHDVPVDLELRAGTVLGICGAEAESAARALLLQAVVAAGPADLAIEVPDTEPWAWRRWCPHPAPRAHDDFALAVADAHAHRPAGEVTAATIVAAARRDALPAACTVILELHDDGTGTLASDGERHALTHVDRVPTVAALRVSRALAGWRDPEASGGGLPSAVRIDEVCPLVLDPGAVVARWRDRSRPGPATAVIGRGARGTVTVDLDADGPHLLVAGTTGSGKSELLRTLVVGLALTAGPHDLTFLLADFKGGSALDPCAALPHVTATVTDLDPSIAVRVLAALHAELTRREQVLRRDGATDLASHRRVAADPLPRLVVVIDEFASLATGRPEVLDELVEVARRGRSLGVHLVLATQHPGSTVREGIRANIDTRIALRLVDAADARAAIDDPAPAALPRSPRGRALLRRGADAPELLQVALVTDGPAVGEVALRPPGSANDASGVADDHDGCRRLVAELAAAWAADGGERARGPWVDPLPTTLAADDPRLHHPHLGDPRLGKRTDDAGRVAVGLRDLPGELRQEPWRWGPVDGNLLVAGGPGSGRTSLLVALVEALTARHHPHDLHVYGIDAAGGLADLLGLATVGAVVGTHDLERLGRLLLLLEGELALRRSRPDHRRPPVVVVVDGTASLLGALERLDRSRALERWADLAVDGPAHGIVWVLGSTRPGEVPGPVAARCAHRLALRLADGFDALVWGLPGTATATLPPGRAVDRDGHLVQFTRPGRRPPAVDPIRVDGAGPARIDPLPTRISSVDLPAGRIDRRGSLHLPVGLDRNSATPAVLVLPEGCHALVAGPAGAGRTSTLGTLAAVAERGGVEVVAFAARDLDAQTEGLAALARTAAAGPLLVLVDDADRLPDPPAALRPLIDDPPPGTHVVVAARTDRLRARYGHWTASIRASRHGILLAPDPDLDGELLGCRVPRTLRSGPPGTRGGLLVVDGDPAAVLVADP